MATTKRAEASLLPFYSPPKFSSSLHPNVILSEAMRSIAKSKDLRTNFS